CGSEITDEGLSHLNGLATLREVHLLHTGATRDGVEKLRESLPGPVQVTHHAASESFDLVRSRTIR
ncbi:MAG TPA: hypothetical protein VFW87_24965, partial [Pirellulales bacterium]|nr:hypothetical protein [Pirellulales bacterium]